MRKVQLVVKRLCEKLDFSPGAHPARAEPVIGRTTGR
jgi:hypothetical protein